MSEAVQFPYSLHKRIVRRAEDPLVPSARSIFNRANNTTNPAMPNTLWHSCSCLKECQFSLKKATCKAPQLYHRCEIETANGMHHAISRGNSQMYSVGRPCSAPNRQVLVCCCQFYHYVELGLIEEIRYIYVGNGFLEVCELNGVSGTWYFHNPGCLWVGFEAGTFSGL